MRSRFLVLRVINDRVYSVWAVVYILLMSMLITIMLLYGQHIYKAIGKAFNDEVEYPNTIQLLLINVDFYLLNNCGNS